MRPLLASDEARSSRPASGDALPADYRAFLAIHDGQKGGETIVGNPEEPSEPFQLMSTDEITHELSWFKKNAKSVAADYDEITADDEVKAQFWNAKWIPYAQNGGGDFLCLDMAPTKGGSLGQIILFDHEEPHRGKVSNSFALLLAGWIATIQG